MQESGLVELTRQVVPDEEILAAGVFAPALPVTTVGLASGRIASIAEGIPRFTQPSGS